MDSARLPRAVRPARRRHREQQFGAAFFGARVEPAPVDPGGLRDPLLLDAKAHQLGEAVDQRRADGGPDRGPVSGHAEFGEDAGHDAGDQVGRVRDGAVEVEHDGGVGVHTVTLK